jgi:hypothetical protein
MTARDRILQNQIVIMAALSQLLPSKNLLQPLLSSATADSNAVIDAAGVSKSPRRLLSLQDLGYTSAFQGFSLEDDVPAPTIQRPEGHDIFALAEAQGVDPS